MLASLAILNDVVTLPRMSSTAGGNAVSGNHPAFDLETIEALLTRQGFEIEGRTRRGAGLEGVVVGRITEAKPHPGADRLRICQVDTGKGVGRQIVCGAPNARPGLFVAVALPGVSLPQGLTIAATSIRGVASGGMLCSRSELGLPVIDVDGTGIWELEADASCGLPGRTLEPLIGEPVFDALGLSDTLLDISVTPNRPDALCHLGIAREIFVGLRQMGIKAAWRGTEWLHDVAKEHLSRDDMLSLAQSAELSSMDKPQLVFQDGRRLMCANELGVKAFFMGFEGLESRPSPGWLRRRLESIGQNSVNDVVDLSNLLLHVLGQPSHAFDFDRLSEERSAVCLKLRKATPQENFLGLDGKSRQLHADDCVVTSEDTSSEGASNTPRVEALLGVIGGETAKVAIGTSRIVVEWANPDAVSVRRSSRRIGRKTDSGFQFEKGLDAAARLYAAKVFADFIKVLHPNARCVGLCGWPSSLKTLSEGFGLWPQGTQASENVTAPDLANLHESGAGLYPWHDTSLASFVGCARGGKALADWPQQLSILGHLGFRFFNPNALGDSTSRGGNLVISPAKAAELPSLAVLVPHWRRLDVAGEADLAEEVARVVGIDHVEGVPMILPLDAKPDDGHLEFFEQAAAASAHLGYTEISSFHFMREDDWKRLGLASDDALGPPVRVVNPIIADEPLMHTTLLPDLLRKVAYNLNHGTVRGQLFHICRTFQNLDKGGALVFQDASLKEQTPLAELGSKASWRGTSHDPAFALATSTEARAAERPAETPRLALVAFGPRATRHWLEAQDSPWNVHRLMGHLRDLASRLGCSISFEPLGSSHPWHGALHPGQCAAVTVHSAQGDAFNCGWVGCLHPRTLRAFSIAEATFAAELNLALLYSCRRGVKEREKPVFRSHRLPAVRRDFAVIVPHHINAAAIEAVVRSSFADACARLHHQAPEGSSDALCRWGSFAVFDVYKGTGVPEGHKSLAFEIVMEPVSATLSDEQILAISQSIVGGLEQSLGARLRT